MRALARAAASSLVLLCTALALVAVVVAALGIAGTRSAASQGNAIAGDELTTAIVTGELARDIDAAYAAGQAAVLTTDQAERARLLATLYTSPPPAVDALKRTFAQATMTKAPLALVLLDLDHFKQVNDQRGHAVGDQVLANVGADTSADTRPAPVAASANGGPSLCS